LFKEIPALASNMLDLQAKGGSYGKLHQNHSIESYDIMNIFKIITNE
jgi:hypothetical protein